MNNESEPLNHPHTRTFVVTWQTVVEMNSINDEMDIPWAVCVAAGKMRDILSDPTEGDNYFTVEEIGNRASKRHILNLAEAEEKYDLEMEEFSNKLAE